MDEKSSTAAVATDVSASPSQLKFPKQARILSKNHFRGVMRANQKRVGNALIVHYRMGKSRCPKLGLTVSKKYGNAVKRNRFKRLVREAFRKLTPELPPDLELNIQPRFPPKTITLKDVTYELSKFRATESC